MKRIIQLITIWLLLAIGFWSCVGDENEEYNHSGASFSLNVECYSDNGSSSQSDDTRQQTRADGSTITQLVTGVYNSAGALLPNVHVEISADYSSATIEGFLPDGTYKIAFMGVGAVFSEEKPIITVPANISDTWLNSSEQDKPCLNEYFYADADIAVSGGTFNCNPSVTMRRLVGLVEIDPIIDNGQFPMGSITQIVVSFDSGTLYSGHTIQGGYTGNTQFSGYTINTSKQFYTLPSQHEAVVKGHVTIYGKRYNEVETSLDYPFEVAIGRNKKTIIRPHYDMDGDEYGMIRLYDSERNASNSTLFFQDGQSYKSVAARSFYPASPLSVSFNKNKKKAIISHYATIGVKDVTILAKRKNDNEYFELAWVESMKPFEERTISTPENRIYRTESGGAVYIDNIENARLYFKYKSKEEFLNKVNKITWPIKIEFVSPTADTLTLKGKVLFCRPVHAREYVHMFTNMGYVLSNDWRERMLATEKTSPFVDDDKNPVSLTNVFFPKIWEPISAQDHLKVYVINNKDDASIGGLSNVGDGNSFGIIQAVIFNYENNPYSGYATPYHEYGHVLGYGHTSDFTYNKLQTISAKTHADLYRAGATPYTSNSLNSGSNPNRYILTDGVWQ